MKIFPQTRQHKILFVTVSALIIIISAFACATKEAFLISETVPAARGMVTVKTDRNNNYVIKIRIYNLAEPERLQNAGDNYIVWLTSEDKVTRNIGQIKSSTSFLSKKLDSSFETVSSIKPSKIFITAEEEPESQYPTSQVVISTGVF